MVSIIIPTLNEEANLARTLAPACSAAVEIVVVDGGSTDGTLMEAGRLGVRAIQAPVPGRAAQLNFGASATTGDILLFLHADTILPKGAAESIERALRRIDVAGGAFARQFASDSLFLKCTCLAAEIRNRVLGWHLGDQAMFVRRSVFEQLGGFKLVPRFEDLDFSRRMATVGRVVTLRPPVITSARRFEKEGPLLRTWSDLRLTVNHLRTVSY